MTMFKGAAKQPTRRSVTAKHPNNVFESECRDLFFQITLTITPLLIDAVIETRKSKTQVMMLVTKTADVCSKAGLRKTHVFSRKLWSSAICAAPNYTLHLFASSCIDTGYRENTFVFCLSRNCNYRQILHIPQKSMSIFVCHKWNWISIYLPNRLVQPNFDGFVC